MNKIETTKRNPITSRATIQIVTKSPEGIKTTMYLYENNINNCKILAITNISNTLSYFNTQKEIDDFIDAIAKEVRVPAFFISLGKDTKTELLKNCKRCFKFFKLPLGYSGRDQHWYFFKGTDNSGRIQALLNKKRNFVIAKENYKNLLIKGEKYKLVKQTASFYTLKIKGVDMVMGKKRFLSID